MRDVPKDLSGLILRYEQMKINLLRNRENKEVREYVGVTFVDGIKHFATYDQKPLGAEYLTWYVEYINDRLS